MKGLGTGIKEFKKASSGDEVPKIKDSRYVYNVTLKDNHRHEALDDVLKLLYSYQ
jgi:Sec-independent protein translocase protein TatA